MQNLEIIKCSSFFLAGFLMIMIIISSCSHNDPVEHVTGLRSDTLIPQINPVSVKPAVHYVDSNFAPQTVIIPSDRPLSNIVKTNGGSKSITLLPPVKKHAGFFVSMQHYTAEQGLAGNLIISSCVDKRGNLWFGASGSGVSRYDGKTFTNFTTAQGLASSIITSICEDNKGNMWFGTDGGVSVYDGISFTSYTTKQGLLSNYVRCLLEDKKGNMWIGTDRGLSRLVSGRNSFTNYATRHSVWSMQEDNNGNIWMGTFDGVLVLNINRDSISIPVNTFGFEQKDFSEICKDRNGNLLICAPDGVFRSDLNGTSFTNITPGKKNIFRALEDKNGDFWFSANYLDGAYFLDHKTGIGTHYTSEEGLSNNLVSCIVEDQAGNIWFGYWGGGVSRLDINGKSLLNYAKSQGLPADDVQCVMEDNNGNIWFGTQGGGICFLNKRDSIFTSYSTSQGLSGNTITSLLQDKQGNFWFAGVLGVSMLDRNKKSFINFTQDQGLISNYVLKAFEDQNGNLWFGTNSGVSKLDKDRKYFTNYTTAQGLINDFINEVFEDSEGNIWFGTMGGISKLDKSSSFFTNYNIGSSKNKINSSKIPTIFEDTSGNIWFGSEGGVFRYDKVSFLNFSSMQGMGDNVIDDIWQDKRGIIWMGTDKGLTALNGFVQNTSEQTHTSGRKKISAANKFSNSDLESLNFQPEFKIYNHTTGYSINGLYYNGMCITSDGAIWACASPKVSRFDHSKIIKNDSPPNVYIQSIKINNENICWYDLVKNNIKIASNSTPPDIVNEITLFGKVLNHAERDSIFKKFSNITFDSITPFFPLPVNLSLPYNHNNITFDFAATELARPSLVRYQYILEGYDKDWSQPGNETKASFGNIYECSYTFKLKAQSPDGVWSKVLVYTFKVLPPWYRTWWAYTFYFIAFTVVLWSFIKWRERTLKREKIALENKIELRTNELKEEKEKVESTLAELEATQSQLIEAEKKASIEKSHQAVLNERLRIGRELHDEVGATLSGIAMYSHLAREQIKKARTTEVEKSLNIMQQSAGAMVNKLNDIVWLINPDQDSLQKLMQRLEEYARDMAAIKNMQVKVNVPEHLHEHSLPMESRRNIYLFCKEAINNAVKYSNGTLLELNIKEANNTLEFSVSDNGKGFDAVMIRRGNGLENMQKRADEVGAKLTVQSKQGEGSLVSMQLKITH